MCGDIQYYFRLWKKQAVERKEQEHEAEQRKYEMTRSNPELYKFMTHLLDCSCVFCADMRKELGLPSYERSKTKTK